MTNENEVWKYRALIEVLEESITECDQTIERVLNERDAWEHRALWAEKAIRLLRRAKVGSQSFTSVSADGPMATPQGDR